MNTNMKMGGEKGEEPAKRLVFIRSISRQGDVYVITIPKALYPMLEEGGFIGRKLRITLEK